MKYYTLITLLLFSFNINAKMCTTIVRSVQLNIPGLNKTEVSSKDLKTLLSRYANEAKISPKDLTVTQLRVNHIVFDQILNSDKVKRTVPVELIPSSLVDSVDLVLLCDDSLFTSKSKRESILSSISKDIFEEFKKGIKDEDLLRLEDLDDPKELIGTIISSPVKSLHFLLYRLNFLEEGVSFSVENRNELLVQTKYITTVINDGSKEVQEFNVYSYPYSSLSGLTQEICLNLGLKTHDGGKKKEQISEFTRALYREAPSSVQYSKHVAVDEYGFELEVPLETGIMLIDQGKIRKDNQKWYYRVEKLDDFLKSLR